MTYYQRVSLLMTLDSLIVLFSFFAAYYFLHPASTLALSIWTIAALTVLVFCNQLLAFYFRLYNKAWEYASIGELKIIIQIVTYSLLIAGFVFYLLDRFDIRLFIMMWLLQVFLISGSRFFLFIHLFFLPIRSGPSQLCPELNGLNNFVNLIFLLLYFAINFTNSQPKGKREQGLCGWSNPEAINTCSLFRAPLDYADYLLSYDGRSSLQA